MRHQASVPKCAVEEGQLHAGFGCLGFQRRNNSPKLSVMGRAVGVQLCNWVCVTRVREAWMKGLYLWSWG